MKYCQKQRKSYFSFKLMNYKDKYSVDLLSRNTKVDLNKNFLDH